MRRLTILCSDTRLGMQAQTVSCDFQKVFRMNDKTMVGLAGLATDVQTVYARAAPTPPRRESPSRGPG